MKKIFLILCIYALSSCVGYEPVYSNKDFNFYISKITAKNNDSISKKIIRNLRSYSNQVKSNELILEIDSNKQENILSKDNKGNPLLYEVKIKIDIKIFYSDKIQNFQFTESFSYNNQANKFELSEYKKNVEKNLVDRITEKLIMKLQTIK